MRRIIASLLVFCALSLVALRPVSAVIPTLTMDTVFVGNAGNPQDPTDGDSFVHGIQNFGAVPEHTASARTK